MTNLIDFGLPTIQVMDSIGYDNFFINYFLFSCMIKIDARKIKD